MMTVDIVKGGRSEKNEREYFEDTIIGDNIIRRVFEEKK